MLALPARGLFGILNLAGMLSDLTFKYLAKFLDYMITDPLKVVFGVSFKRSAAVLLDTLAEPLPPIVRIARLLENVLPRSIYAQAETAFAGLGSVYLQQKQYLHDIASGDDTLSRFLCVGMGYIDALCTVAFVSALGEPVLGKFGKAVAEASASHAIVIKVISALVSLQPFSKS
jgi:hypothetical protein